MIGEPHRLRLFGRKHLRTEAEWGAVGELDRFVFVVHLEHLSDGAEELLVVGRVAGVDIGEHGGRKEVALACSACDNRSPVSDGSRDLVFETFCGTGC